MSAARKLTVGVIFGGRSVEHDVSVVTGQQVIRAFDPERYTTVPIYVDRDGRWFTGEPLRNLDTFKGNVSAVAGVKPALLSPATNHHGLIIDPLPRGWFQKPTVVRLDAAFPALHGSHGEDGTMQGLFELADIPYVGCGVMASAIANDKMMAKEVLRQHNIPVVDAISFTRAEWERNGDALLQQALDRFSFPLFVKPVTLGSSIGIGKADDATMLRALVDVAANLDRRILIEPGVQNAIEINCAVLGGDDDIQASVLEQPVSWDNFLTYDEKYLRGGEGMKSADRVIPAPISTELTNRIQTFARDAFRAIDGRGTARIDFLLQPADGTVYLNEINTLPGSFAFYLWQATNLPPRAFVERLVQIAQSAHAAKRRNTYNYETDLINVTAARGLGGAKGSKGKL